MLDHEQKKEILRNCEQIIENIIEIHNTFKQINIQDETDTLLQIDYINDCLQEIKNNLTTLTNKSETLEEEEIGTIIESMNNYYEERLFAQLEEEVDKMIMYLQKK